MTEFLNSDHADDDLDIDEEFPLGDGVAETSADVICPYCSEAVTIAVDPGGGSFQEYVEDCEVCCNPWKVKVRFADGIPGAEVTALDE